MSVSHETKVTYLKHKVCPVCFSKNISKKFKARSYRITSDYFEIDECKDCGHGFTNPVPDQESIGEFYKSANYISHTNSSKSLMDVVYQMVRKYSLLKKKKIIDRFVAIENDGRFLDYGAGTGHFVDFLNKNKRETIGLEISEEARQMAPKEVKSKIFPIDHLNTIDHISGFSMWHVLEHIYEPEVLLKTLASKMDSFGAGFIAVPNNGSYDAHFYKENWAALDVPLHFSHFNKSSMIELIKRSGLKLVDVKNMPFDSFYISMLSEESSLSKLNGLFRGFVSNLKGRSTKNMSSLIFVVRKN